MPSSEPAGASCDQVKIEPLTNLKAIVLGLPFVQKLSSFSLFQIKTFGRLHFSQKLRSSSISQKNEVVFHLGSYFTPVWPLSQALFISSFFTTSPDGRPAGRVAGRAGAGGNKIKAISAFKLSLTWSLGWAWQKCPMVCPTVTLNWSVQLFRGGYQTGIQDLNNFV